MNIESKIALNCPFCGESIHEEMVWFKQADFVCQACGKGLTADLFTQVIDDLEQALDANIDEMVCEPQHTSCCGKKTSCCKGH